MDAFSQEISFPQADHSLEVSMGDMASILPSSQDSGAPSTPSKFAPKPAPNTPAISPPNPFRNGRVKVNLNMSPEAKKANILRELRAATPNSATPHHSEGSTSSSPTKKKAKSVSIAEKQSTLDTEEEDVDVTTIYNPAAAEVPIRIYVLGEDPSYVEPTPLQWSEKNAQKWGEFKADFVKRGLEIVDTLARWRARRGAVFYWECTLSSTSVYNAASESRTGDLFLVYSHFCAHQLFDAYNANFYVGTVRGPSGEKISQWTFYKETSKRNDFEDREII